MNDDQEIPAGFHMRSLREILTVSGLLFFLFLSIIMAPVLALLSFSVGQPSAQNRTLTEEVDAYNHNSYDVLTVSKDVDAGRSTALHLLQANIPASSDASRLATTNYQEDRAVREAILAGAAQWEADGVYYRTSNQLHVYLGNAQQAQSISRAYLSEQSERTVLTARILLGLWNSRRTDPRLSLNGRAVIHPDEILAWRGVQKHQRLAYAGASKRFSDGYPWQRKQQVIQDLELLQLYYLRGYHIVMGQGKMVRMPVDSPYLLITPLKEMQPAGSALSGYLVSPGSWINDYESNKHFFLAEIDRKIFQFNPQNDQLALRMALYLVERWRQQASTGRYKEPVLMMDLLAASMISIDKANLTSRFAPRVEAALQKLYEQGIVGEAPLCLSCVDRTKAQWGKDWLAASWSILPPQDMLQRYAARLPSANARIRAQGFDLV